MRLSLKSDVPALQGKLAEYEKDETITNIEVLELSKLADDYMAKVQAEYLNLDKDVFQVCIDDISQAMQKMAIEIEKNKPSQEDSDNLNAAIQFQLAQLVINYNRTVGKVKFKSGFLALSKNS
ncbi:hypothetical protein L579_3474 [Pantoea sp. AS-PWVM4]|uniref:Uncharacterized protein n=1 Tax=Pantoea phytobeneficialis TaxID=2052056 RepID=A0ABT8XQ99_9GAMM|nr:MULTISPECIES: hypothetical protein [Pantoea]ERK17594.1 hypothetical protein L579_3474 [Pantoea sp. AS-PWVM4]MDO6405608.1 hypothetical protein [Pantoea phytobeneficialis]